MSSRPLPENGAVSCVLTAPPRPVPHVAHRPAASQHVVLLPQMGLKRVIFVGHADGALVALLATAMAAHPRTSGGHPTGWPADPALGHSDDDVSIADTR